MYFAASALLVEILLRNLSTAPEKDPGILAESLCESDRTKHLCQSLCFTLTQVFSCEFCEISKNASLNRTPLAAASGEITEITPKKVNAVKVKNLLEQPGSLP